MTRNEIMKLSGRDLDAAVAEHVLGWTPWLEQRGDTKYIIWQVKGDLEPWTRFRCEAQEREQNRYSRFDATKFDPMKHVEPGLPRFSKDIESAWRIIEYINLPTLVGYHWGRNGEAHVTIELPSKEQISIGGLTIPEAICRAALLGSI